MCENAWAPLTRYKTEQKLALGGWHSANVLALLLDFFFKFCLDVPWVDPYQVC